MGGTNRRLFLTGMGSILLRRAAPALGGGMLAVVSSPAQAWVMQALGVANSIVGMLGGRSDGGVGAMLQANHDQLKLVLQEVAKNNYKLDKILEEIKNSKDEHDRILTKHETKNLQDEVVASCLGYEQLMKERSHYQSYEGWRQLPSTQRSALYRYDKLNDARLLIEAKAILDPATALVATSACFVQLSLLIMTDSQPPQLAILVGEYRSWFEKILDPSLDGSAARYVADARARLAQRYKDAAESDFGKAYGIEPGQKLFVCTGVNDYKPGQRFLHRRPGCRDFSQSSSRPAWMLAADERPQDSDRILAGGSVSVTREPGQGIAGVDDPQSFVPEPPAVFAWQSEAQYGPCVVVHHERDWNGPQERLAQDVVLREVEFVLEGKQTGLLQLEVALQPDRFGAAGQQGLPPDASCSVEALDQKDQAARKRHMTSMARRRTAEESLSKFQVIVAQINLERARVMFGVQAMLATEQARQKLNEFQERFR